MSLNCAEWPTFTADSSAEAAGRKSLSLFEPLEDLKSSAFGSRASLEIPRNVKANVEQEQRSLRDSDALFSDAD